MSSVLTRIVAKFPALLLERVAGSAKQATWRRTAFDVQLTSLDVAGLWPSGRCFRNELSWLIEDGHDPLRAVDPVTLGVRGLLQDSQ